MSKPNAYEFDLIHAITISQDEYRDARNIFKSKEMHLNSLYIQLCDDLLPDFKSHRNMTSQTKIIIGRAMHPVLWRD